MIQATGRPTLREQQLKLREDVILREVNLLLAEKGYDLMTVDEVAARVGIAKPSLYKHFESKEALAAAAMVRLLERTRDAIKAQPAKRRRSTSSRASCAGRCASTCRDRCRHCHPPARRCASRWRGTPATSTC